MSSKDESSSSPSFFDQLGDRAKRAFADAEKDLRESVSKIEDEIDNIKNTDAGKKIFGELSALQDRVEKQAKEFTHEKIRMIQEFEKEKKSMIAGALSKKLSAAIGALLNILVVKIKDALTEDEYMPRFVKNLMTDFVDAIWPDISDDIREKVLELAHPQENPIDHGEPGCFAETCCCTCCGKMIMEPAAMPPAEDQDYCCCCEGCCCKVDLDTPCYGPIAYLLYIQFPYDMSIWRKIRKPFWWFLTLVSAIPKYGISTLFYVLLFIITDKSDEFQLLQFLTSFKCLQFVSVGVISLLVAAGQLAVCTLPSSTICDEFAPREQLHTILLFVVQVFISWACILLLPRAQQKGGLRYQINRVKADKLREKSRNARQTLLESMATETVEAAFFEEDTDGSAQYGRLIKLLIYDTVIFCLCAGLVAWSAFANLLDETAEVENYDAADPFVVNGRNWKFQLILYFAKCFYGLCALPWLFLLVPGISSLFSRAKPTGYNPYGVVVPFLGEEQETVPWRRPKTDAEIKRDKEERDRRQKLREERLEKMEQEEEKKRDERIAQNPVGTTTGTALVVDDDAAESNNNENHYPDRQQEEMVNVEIPFSDVNLIFYNNTLAHPEDITTIQVNNIVSDDTEQSVKPKIIAARPQLQNEDFYLAINGKYMEDGKTVKDYGVDNNGMIQVIRHSDLVQQQQPAASGNPLKGETTQPQW